MLCVSNKPIMLNVVKPTDVMTSVITLRVVLLNVVAQKKILFELIIHSDECHSSSGILMTVILKSVYQSTRSKCFCPK